MAFDLANILVFLLFGGMFVLTGMVASSILRPYFPDPNKSMIYECGERPIGAAWFNFNPRFYIIALIFVIFDVEIAFTFPVAVIFKRWVDAGAGAIALFELGVFIAILLMALVYVWKKGDLEWIRRLQEDKTLARGEQRR